MNKVKVEQMKNEKGRSVENHFIIFTDDGKYFQSYRSIIAFIPKGRVYSNEMEGFTEENAKIKLDETYWNYSRTTSKYRCLFLDETRIQTEAKIKSDEYILSNLN